MDITDIRQRINTVDDQLLGLFLERMQLAEEVAAYKKANHQPITNKAREREILKSVQERAGENEEYAFHFFTKLMDLSKARQRELLAGDTRVRALIQSALLPAETVFPQTGTVACQGVEGANSQAACDKLLPRGSILYVKSFEAVFDAVEQGICDYGLVPIENNINGSVRKVYELLQNRRFSIVRATSLNIRHELMVKKGTKLSAITEITSHEQALGQCGRYLASLGNNVKLTPCANTAMAAKAVADCADGHLAAIASHPCAELYGLEVIKTDIQDSDNNYTKFILITKTPAIYAGANRLSLIAACNNQPGALGDILSAFSAHGINMVKLESCPVTGRNFEFIFYIELDASVREPGVLPMLEDLERTCEGFAFLGNYPVL